MSKHTSSPERSELLIHVHDSLRALYTHELGESNPDVTAMAHALSYCLTFVRTAISHGIVDADFDSIVAMALEHEADGWNEHREHCVKCGGH